MQDKIKDDFHQELIDALDKFKNKFKFISNVAINNRNGGNVFYVSMSIDTITPTTRISLQLCTGDRFTPGDNINDKLSEMLKGLIESINKERNDIDLLVDKINKEFEENRYNKPHDLHVISSTPITKSGIIKFPQGKDLKGVVPQETTNIWDPEQYPNSYIYITKFAMFVAAPGTFEIGDKIGNVYNNDGDHRKLSQASNCIIIGKCPCNQEAFENEYRRVLPRNCSKPNYSFGRYSSGIPYSYHAWGNTYFVK